MRVYSIVKVGSTNKETKPAAAPKKESTAEKKSTKK
jgi:hypothetical protein